MTTVPTSSAKRLVFRNTLISFGAQAIGTPISILITAITARYLGAEDYGLLYLAFMMTVLGFQFVELGHGQVLTGDIARDRSRAGDLLGASLAWRVIATLLVTLILEALTFPLGYTPRFRLVLALVVVQCFFQALSTACQDSVRGFERTDVGALGQIGTQLLNLALVVPTLMLGGGILGVLAAQALASAVILLLVLRAMKAVGVGRLRATFADVKSLGIRGFPFLSFSLALALQPSADAMFLSQLSPPEVVGWYAVTRRLTGALVLPAAMVIGALYPTLSRLFVTDMREYQLTTRSAVGATTALAVPVALSCALYPDIGVGIFSKEAYAGAQQNLVVVSFTLYLMYLSMPLGIALIAAKRQKVWAAVQSICVVVSCLLDPLLIPWFQARYGNGGLGIAVASGISEVLMVAAAVWLTPKGVLDRSVAITILRALGAGLAMSVIAFALRRTSSFVAAPAALATYVVALWAVGGLGRSQLDALRGALQRKQVALPDEPAAR
jgi:O-antigen/teichoic acid export membrane protein